MSQNLRRKPNETVIARKPTAASSPAGAMASSAATAASTIAPFVSARSSAAAQLHRSLKAWRSEADEKSAGEDADAAKDDAGDKAKPAGGDEAAAGDDKAAKQGALEGGGEAKGEKPEGGSSSAAGGEEPAAKPQEEAPAIGTKLKVLTKRKDLTPAQVKEKEEKLAKQKELCLSKVELAAKTAEQTQKIVDLVAGLGVDALLTLAGPAAPVLTPIIKSVVGVAKDGTNLALDTQREVKADVISKAINTMSDRQIRMLANNWTKVEPTLKECEARVQPQLELLKSAGLNAKPTDYALAGGKGALSEGAKKAAEGFIEKWIPFIGTIRSIGELIGVVNEIATLRETIQQLEEDLK